MKLMKKPLLTITMVDLEQFISKKKLVIYSEHLLSIIIKEIISKFIRNIK